MTLRTTLTAGEAPKDWKGDLPQVTVFWHGPLFDPVREVDAAAFVNGLAARAIARDQERIQLMQDDLRERAFFARRLRAIEDEQRTAREAAEKARAATKAAVPTEDAIRDKLLSLPPPEPPSRPVFRPQGRPTGAPAATPSPPALPPLPLQDAAKAGRG